MRKRLSTILRRIIRCRAEKRTSAVISGWAEYTLTAEGLRKGWQCFNCNKRSDGIDYLMPCGKGTELLYFCSPECEAEFKALLRQV